MKWNYRILDHGNFLALHEVYYDENGNPRSYTENATSFVCDLEDGAEGIGRSLELAIRATKLPIIKVSEQWPEEKN